MLVSSGMTTERENACLTLFLKNNLQIPLLPKSGEVFESPSKRWRLKLPSRRYHIYMYTSAGTRLSYRLVGQGYFDRLVWACISPYSKLEMSVVCDVCCVHNFF